MVLETIGAVAKEVAEVAAEVAEKTAEEMAKMEAESLPTQIGELLEISDLPDEIGETINVESLPDEISDADLVKKDSSDMNNPVDDPIAEANTEYDKPEKKGGSYGDVFKEGEGDTYEVHHMPADSASYLERDDVPAIKMEKADHRQTASCGSSREAREYRAQQKELIDQGKFREALQMDIDDIHEKFGDKYDDAIAEMLEYVDKLEAEGKING